MARVAGCRRVCVVVVCVALRACQRGVHPRERVVGILGVVEVDGCPARCGVAGIAGRRKCRCSVIGVRGASPIRLVASVAVCRQRCVVVIGVALCARHRGVGASQREYRRVIEG